MPPSPITRQLAALLGREPVDVEQARTGPSSPKRSRQVIMSSWRRVREARALGVDLGDVAAEHVLHDVEVVGREVDRHARRRGCACGSGPTRVAWARKTRPSRPSSSAASWSLPTAGLKRSTCPTISLRPRLARGAAHAQRVRQASWRSASRRARACRRRGRRARSRRAYSDGQAMRDGVDVAARVQQRRASRRTRSIGRRSRARLARAPRSGSATATTRHASRRSQASTWKPPMRPAPMTPTRSSSVTPKASSSSVSLQVRRCERRDPLALASPSPKIGGRSAGAGGAERRAEALGVDADERVPAGLDRVDPLGLLAQRDAGDAPQVGLALDAARVGGDACAPRSRASISRVGDRLDAARRWSGTARPRHSIRRARCAGAAGRRPASGRPAEAVEHGPQARRVVGVVVAMDRREQVLGRSTSPIASRASDSSMSQSGSPVHVDGPADAFGLEVAPRALVGREAARRRGGRSRRGCAPPACPRGSCAGPPRRGSAAARRRRRRGRRRASRSCRRGRGPRPGAPRRSRRSSRSAAERDLLVGRARADAEVVVRLGQPQVERSASRTSRAS